jgi:hypothetical protein
MEATDNTANVVITNTASITFDGTPPTTNVNPLPTYVNKAIFDVGYNATDALSGVKHVGLYYRKAGGSWAKYGTTFTTSPISFDSSTTGSDGVYEFYTVGTDRADNVEAPPASTDASTTVDTAAPTVASVSPPSGYIREIGQTVIKFGEAMDTSKLVWGGTMESEKVTAGSTTSEPGGVDTVWNSTNDTLTVSPSSGATWKGGVERTLTIDVKDLAGNPISTLNLSYTVPGKWGIISWGGSVWGM